MTYLSNVVSYIYCIFKMFILNALKHLWHKTFNFYTKEIEKPSLQHEPLTPENVMRLMGGGGSDRYTTSPYSKELRAMMGEFVAEYLADIRQIACVGKPLCGDLKISEVIQKYYDKMFYATELTKFVSSLKYRRELWLPIGLIEEDKRKCPSVCPKTFTNFEEAMDECQAVERCKKNKKTVICKGKEVVLPSDPSIGNPQVNNPVVVSRGKKFQVMTMSQKKSMFRLKSSQRNSARPYEPTTTSEVTQESSNNLIRQLGLAASKPRKGKFVRPKSPRLSKKERKREMKQPVRTKEKSVEMNNLADYPRQQPTSSSQNEDTKYIKKSPYSHYSKKYPLKESPELDEVTMKQFATKSLEEKPRKPRRSSSHMVRRIQSVLRSRSSKKLKT